MRKHDGVRQVILLRGLPDGTGPIMTVRLSRMGEGYYLADEVYDMLVSLTSTLGRDYATHVSCQERRPDINDMYVDQRSDGEGVYFEITPAGWSEDQTQAFLKMVVTLSRLHEWTLVDEREATIASV